jgi:hypothetical protein
VQFVDQSLVNKQPGHPTKQRCNSLLLMTLLLVGVVRCKSWSMLRAACGRHGKTYALVVQTYS